MNDDNCRRFFDRLILTTLAAIFLFMAGILALIFVALLTAEIHSSSNEPSLTNSVVMGEATAVPEPMISLPGVA